MNAVVVKDGRIADIRPLESGNSSVAGILAETGMKTALDYGSDVISPGIVDLHCHFDEPGRADWEGRCPRSPPTSDLRTACEL